MSAPDSATGLHYRDAGVDVDAADAAIEQAKDAIRSTFGPRVLADVGLFGGLFSAAGLAKDPVLVATTDGVGTKVRIAAAVGRYDSVGHDIVHHCINDALVQGAEPLFFLDYVGVGRLDPGVVAALIRGCAAACKAHGVALLGGETAEMPGLYPPGEFDLVGTLVGVVEREHLLDGGRVRAGDRLLGLASSGLHTNGYSLARRIVEERLRWSYADPFPDMGGRSVADVLLEPHRCYLETLRPLLRLPALHAMAHITGSGVPGNLPRVLRGMGARVSRAAVPGSPLFTTLVQAGGVEREEAWRSFNMGVGMILVVDPGAVRELQAALRASGATAFEMGHVDAGLVEEVAWLD
ncbi:MAG: phosphoribosylformylglycinamidine cyclo-ligase [Planctomycetota bacterium]|nr:MAG: phosphoribosylformylglycinamidine cyclo-ligase [Planctomycetota bacterium]